MMSGEFDNILFDMPKSQSNAIKVIGVGGGGSNAVNHMFQQDIKGVDFVICNTDAQALDSSSIPNKIQLGVDLTSGLGAGANPEVGASAAKESIEQIQQMLGAQTKMVFITAGMGGGTGTGAAPIIARIAKDMDILTVGIVTMPFQFEGRMRSKQAQIGIDTLRSNVDSLIVINNNKLREVYGNLGFKAGFSKADEVLSTAARGIAEVITHHYKQNIDLHDAKTVLSDSGTAIMGSAKESGVNRGRNSIVKALDSPLLNDNKITGAKNVLLLIVSGTDEVTIDEIGEINDYIQTEAGYDANIIMGIGEDDSLGDAISVTVVATGFASDQQSSITNTEVKKTIYTLEEEQKATYDFSEDTVIKSNVLDAPIEREAPARIVHVLEDDLDHHEEKETLISTTDFINNINVTYDEVAAEKVSEDDFIITDATPKVQEEIPKTPVQLQADLLFDFPIRSNEETEPAQKEEVRLEDVNEIEVKDFTEIVAEKREVVEKRYVLEDFSAEPTIGKSSKITQKQPKVSEEEVEFTLRSKVQKVEDIETISEEISPLSLTISELERTAELRRQKKEVRLEDVNEIEVKDFTEIVAEKREVVEKRYVLEDFTAEPTIGKSSKITQKQPRVSEEEVEFTLRSKVQKVEDIETISEEISPLSLTISELERTAELRRQKMKGFNYKFADQVNKNIDEIERQPAYKRLGVNLDQVNSDLSKSKTTLSTDANDDAQLRSNNSFLHDNVD